MADQISQRFSHDELRSATRNFNEALIIGCGGFGKVYKGYLLNGSNPCVVAIKQLNSISNQGFKEFRAEIEMLSQIRHCNLVSLIGYCDEGQEEMALVYEYMRHGTLSEHLHKTSFPLSWLQRLKICIGVGRGLDYLHTGTGTRQGIIHRDVKSSNILLDENFEARISDFGLAKIGPANQLRMHVTTGVKGTFGYMDPCYFYTGELTRKSDVYAFGVVMLEMMCGRPAVDSSLKEDQWSLASWAQGYIEKGKVNDILDYRIRAQVSNSNTCVKDFAHIAHRCLHGEPNKRPTMAEIVPKIELILSLQERLDSSLTKVNFIDKVLSCFSANVEAKSNLITAGESVDERNVTSSQCTNGNLRSFSFDVLKAATRNFRWGTVLGESGSDSVFKGWIHEPSLTYAKPGAGTPVAVKRFDIDTRYKETEWLAEIDYLGKKLSHPNITSLIGYCLEDEQRILVYEFMHRGSLENHLFRRGPYMNILPWDRRIKIMLGAAKGLAYLHSTEANVIYCSFNSSSILMDCNDNAKLYKFGLAKDGPVDGKSYVTTEVTPSSSNGCYTAPEYIALGNLTTKCDRYSFGVVLLEIMTGRRCLDENRAPGERILTEFVKPYLKSKKKILRIMDPCLDGQYTITSAMGVARLAMNCLLDESTHRPTADEVVHALEMVRFNITSNCT